MNQTIRRFRTLAVLCTIFLALAGLASCGSDDDDVVVGDAVTGDAGGIVEGDSAADCESDVVECDDTADPEPECAPDAPGCDDAVTGGAAGTCLAGADDCQDMGGEMGGGDVPVEAGMCAMNAPTCDDTVEPGTDPDDGTIDPGTGDEFPTEAARQEAKELLGMPDGDLGPDVRVSQRGDETFPLTEDYVLGRKTVVLSDAGDGTFVVTAVTVELPGGPETFELEG